MTSLILLYTTLGFTDLISVESDRDDIGWFFVAVMAFNISVHLYFMIKSTCGDCKKKCAERKAKNKL